ncbi:TM7S3/TM198-like domain-containing protein [Marmoricola sp. RAF53]|uniref:TM7S3/TM198-like domain-containing protein n=1 Tax=Marmoricola sp. RAF53 TaxID=3233059 RepID=UPI003F9C4172
MADIILGVLAIIAGLFFCFGGQFVMRVVFPIWGAFAGFAFGAGLVAGFSDEHFLGTVLGWVLGIVFAIVFAVLAYLFYAVAVILAMAAAGFALGSGLVVALGIDWSWVAVTIGIVVGALLGLFAVLVDMPSVVLIVFTSIAGAIGVTAGLMLLVGDLNSDDFTRSAFSDRVQDSWGWYLTVVVIAIVAILVQTRQAIALRRSLRENWVAVAVVD